jgi:hypothetical protein
MRILHTAIQIAIQDHLATGEPKRAAARLFHVSRRTISRIAREDPITSVRPTTVTTETITWALAAYYDGAPAAWIKRRLNLTAAQLNRILELHKPRLPKLVCPICRHTIHGICLACLLARRTTPRPTPPHAR